MLKIYINEQPECIDWNLEEAIYNLDEDFVLTGNRDYISRTKAEWWTRATDLINDLETDSFPGECFRYYTDIDREQRKAILKAYEDCRCSDDMEFIVEVANILYPDKKFDTATIRGTCQSDWQEVAYNVNREDDIKYLESFYFGMVSELHLVNDDDDCWDYITDDELWDMEKSDTLSDLVIRFGYEAGTKCAIYKADGYSRTLDYELIEGEEEQEQEQPENSILTACEDIIRKAADMLTPAHVEALKAIFA